MPYSGALFSFLWLEKILLGYRMSWIFLACSFFWACMEAGVVNTVSYLPSLTKNTGIVIT